MQTQDFPISPIDFTVETVHHQANHWHETLELIFVLRGKLLVSMKSQHYTLGPEDLLLINAFELHSLSGQGCEAVFFRIHPRHIHGPMVLDQHFRFQLYSVTSQFPEECDQVRRLLALIVKEHQATTGNNNYMTYAYSYTLIHQLLTWFAIKAEDMETLTTRKRLEHVVLYLQDHFREPLTQMDVAKMFFLSVPYLSKIFKDALGVSFKDYLRDLRLHYSLQLVKDPGLTIDQVAERSGFPNTRSFVAAFKDKYALLPSEFRKSTPLTSPSVPSPSVPSTQFTQHQTLAPLAKYLNNETPTFTMRQHPSLMTEIPAVDVLAKGQPLRHTWKHMVAIGKAKHILYAENQAMLRMIQQDIGFSFLKCHGLLDDDMMVYSEDSLGQPEFNFTYVDMVFDFLLSIGLKPFVQLNFMPRDLALHPERTQFYLASIVSLPKDYHKWGELISQLVTHLNHRYSREEVASWPFSLWNEPDSPEGMFGIGSEAAFFEFYRLTYETVKRMNPDIPFGAPSIMTTTIETGEWVRHFLDYCTKHHCLPAFLNYHFYPITAENPLSLVIERSPSLMLRPSESALSESIDAILALGKKDHWPQVPVYISEWNSSISHRDLLHDTAYKGAYIVKNIVENLDRMESFGYWALSDFIEEVKMSGHLFHGGMGLLTYNGIKKPPYHAYQLLSRMGDQLLQQGPGYLITKKKSQIQILLYHYQHVSPLYASGELFDMTFLDRYTPFPGEAIRKFSLTLTGLAGGTYRVTETLINREHGSAFDSWVRQGGLEPNTLDEVAYLKVISVPFVKRQLLTPSEGDLELTRELLPHEVRLIELVEI